MNKLTITALILIFSCFTIWAQVPEQDTIFTRDGETILCKIKEIGTSEIRYVQPQIKEDVIVAILKNDVERIVYSNGVEQTFNKANTRIETIEQNSEDLFAIQKNKALKLDILGLAVNTLSLTYEQCLRPGRSIEFSAGAIGLGFGLKEEEAAGVLLRGGYKFMQNPDHFLTGMRYAHILRGRYVKLELDFAAYDLKSNKELFGDKENYSITKFAFLIVLGEQWVFDDLIVVDMYSGIGIGTNNLDNLDWSYPYGFTTLGEDLPMAFSAGLRIGILLK